MPIIPDEGRTFGMDPLFSEFDLRRGQKYTPVDHKMLLNYKSRNQAGPSGRNFEAETIASWISSATSYSSANAAAIPFYTFYSMFGFQRVRDRIWSAADARAWLPDGATLGRTTLNGEGLQHRMDTAYNNLSSSLLSSVGSCVCLRASLSSDME